MDQLAQQIQSMAQEITSMMQKIQDNDTSKRDCGTGSIGNQERNPFERDEE